MYHNPKVKVTFGALVDAIIPYTPELAFKQGAVYSAGGLYSHIEEYLIWSLDRFLFNAPLAYPTADLLIIAAGQLIKIGAAGKSYDQGDFPYGSIFAGLSQEDRLKTIALMERLQIDLGILPYPYRNNPTLVQIIADTLNSLTVFGYYSEWSGYDLKSFIKTGELNLIEKPVSWKQVSYPGRAKKYHALRGYLIDRFIE